MPSKRPQLPLRLDPDVRYKLQYIADDNFRPMNKEIERLIIRYIAEYEAEHGEITLPKDS